MSRRDAGFGFRRSIAPDRFRLPLAERFRLPATGGGALARPSSGLHPGLRARSRVPKPDRAGLGPNARTTTHPEFVARFLGDLPEAAPGPTARTWSESVRARIPTVGCRESLAVRARRLLRRAARRVGLAAHCPVALRVALRQSRGQSHASDRASLDRVALAGSISRSEIETRRDTARHSCECRAAACPAPRCAEDRCRGTSQGR